METLHIIAILCQINIGAMGITIDKIKEEQISCHKYYVECIDKAGSFFEDYKILKTCIKNRG